MPAHFGRRSLLGVALAYAALSAGVCAGSWALTRGGPRAPRAEVVPAALLTFLGPLTTGAAIGTWTIEQVGPLHQGGLRLVLRPPTGDPLLLELTRLDPAGPRPLAASAALAVYDLRAAPGLTPPETLAAAAALAAAVRAREDLAPPPLDLLAR